jgi:hypothetical protein
MKTTSKWRLTSRRIIREILAEAHAQGWDDKATLAAISHAYPWGDKSGHVYACWLKERKVLLGSLVGGQGPPAVDEPALDRDYFARLEGPGSPAWEAMLCRKRAELAAAGIRADEWTDGAVADWRPGAKEGAGDG